MNKQPNQDIPIERAMIAWNEKRDGGRIKIIHHPDRTGETREIKFASTAGACWSGWRDMTTEQRKAQLMIEAWHIVVRDGVAPMDAHRALMVIPEYREMISSGMPQE